MRLGLSSTDSVVMTVPSPSLVMPPPSAMIGAAYLRMPSRSDSRLPTAASLSHDGALPPHALKPKWVMATVPSPSTTKIGPLSRIQQSSIGISATSTELPHASSTWSREPGFAITVTGSKRLMVRITSAHSSRASCRCPGAAGHSQQGQDTNVRACSTQRPGIANPSWRGVRPSVWGSVVCWMDMV